MKQTLSTRQELSINLKYCYSARRATHKICGRSAVCPHWNRRLWSKL